VLLVAAPAAAMMAGAIAGAISLRRAKVGALLALSARRDGHGPAAKARCG
jgi:hypothetical protein